MHWNWIIKSLQIIVIASLQINCKAKDYSNTIYQFEVRDVTGNKVKLDKYRNKVVLIVNVASECGFTHSNYAQLKELYDKYKEQGLVIAAFPSNQFGGQEPGTEEEIKRFVKETFDFEPDLYAKIIVNGPNEEPLYTFLKSQKGGAIVDTIKWNFTKFLINRHGKVVERYAPLIEPRSIEGDIVRLLNEHGDL